MPKTLITRREAAELSGISESTVKKAVDQRVVPARRRGSQSCIEVEDVPVLAMLGLLTPMRLAPKHKRIVRRWLRAGDGSDELELMPAIVVRRTHEVEQARERGERYARLRDEWIVRDPDIIGGEPVIRGSRVSVHTLAERIAQGEPVEILEEDFPHIPSEAREVAEQYARANPRRGRPRRAPHTS
jgi:excisionase family DNA binding protein